MPARELLDGMARRLGGQREADLLNPFLRLQRGFEGTAEESSAGTIRAPETLRTRASPAITTKAAGSSAAGSAWAMLPTIVPRLRIGGCATYRTVSRRSGALSATTFDVSSTA